MALSERHRSELYQHFEPELGAELAEAFVREFPKGSGDELVTREYLDLRLDALAGDLRSGIIGQMTTYFIGFTSVIVGAMAIATTVIIAAN
jgi:hypothetical protein